MTFQLSEPCYKPHPQGTNWRSKLCSLSRPSQQKSPWGKDPNVKSPSFPLHCGDTQKVTIPHPSPKCVGGGGGGSSGNKLMVHYSLYLLRFTSLSFPDFWLKMQNSLTDVHFPDNYSLTFKKIFSLTFSLNLL